MVSVTEMTKLAQAAAKGKMDSVLKVLSPRLDKAEKAIKTLQEKLKSLPEDTGDILNSLPSDFSTRLATWASSVMSVPIDTARRPSPLTCPATSSSRSTVRAASTRSAPFSAHLRASVVPSAKYPVPSPRRESGITDCAIVITAVLANA